MKNRILFLCGAVLVCWGFAITFGAAADQGVLLAKTRRNARAAEPGRPDASRALKQQKADQSPAPAGESGDETATGPERGSEAFPPAPADSSSFHFSLPPRPVLAGTTRNEALLRYRLKPQSSFGLSTEVEMQIEMEANGQKISIPMIMGMDGTVKVNSVNADGSFLVAVVLTRMKVDVPGAEGVSYDSSGDQKDTLPQFQPLNACIGVPVTATVTPLGQLLDLDDHVIVEALSRMEDAALMNQFQSMFKKSMECSFIQLSEAPVKEGTVYEAGEMTVPVPEVGEMNQKVGYRILCVSRDKKQILMQPLIAMTLKPAPGAMLTAELSRPCESDGWLLFDTEEGNVMRSALVMGYGMTLSQGTERMTINTDMLMKYEITPSSSK